MAVLKVRIADDLAAAFAEAYPGRGDRSVILRRAVQSFVDGRAGKSEGTKAKVGPPPSQELMEKSPKGRNRSLQYGRTVPVSVRLTPEQYTGIEAQALRLGMETSPYIRALVDAHLDRAPEWPRGARKELTLATTQVRKAGVNLNQLTFLIRTALKEGKPFPVAKDELDQVQQALSVLEAAFLAVLENRDSYWQMKGNRDG